MMAEKFNNNFEDTEGVLKTRDHREFSLTLRDDIIDDNKRRWYVNSHDNKGHITVIGYHFNTRKAATTWAFSLTPDEIELYRNKNPFNASPKHDIVGEYILQQAIVKKWHRYELSSVIFDYGYDHANREWSAVLLKKNKFGELEVDWGFVSLSKKEIITEMAEAAHRRYMQLG